MPEDRADRSVLLEQFVATLLQTSLAPVAIVEADSFARLLRYFLCGPMPCFVDLSERLPATRCQCRREHPKAQFHCHTCSLKQSHLEALQASCATFWLHLHSLHLATPSLMIVVIVDDVQIQRSSIARAFILANQIFFLGEDVGIEVIECGTHVVGQHPFDDGARTWGTAAVQQHFVISSLHRYIKKPAGLKRRTGWV